MTHDELMSKWKSVIESAHHIFTWTEPLTLAYCAERASQSKLAVELGTYMGASAFVMLEASPDLHLWCVDHFKVPGTEHVTRHFLKKHIAEGRCELIMGDSTVAARMLNHVGPSLDSVWVDDGHETEQVLSDIRNFLPLLKRGGTIYGHDFDIPHNDVALGVIKSGIKYAHPVPRVWAHVKE